MQSILYAQTPEQEKMVAAMAHTAAAQAALRKESVKAFGELAAKEIVGRNDRGPVGAIERIDAAQVTIKGDQATVSYGPEPATTFTLQRISGAWRLPVMALAQGADEKAIDQRIADVDLQTRVIQELTTEIAAGKYRNAAQARDAWIEKIMQSLSTRPTTSKTGGE